MVGGSRSNPRFASAIVSSCPTSQGGASSVCPKLPDENPLTLVPDWVCEVLSPSTHRDDRVIKLPLYAREEVTYVWLVDPALRAVEVYEAERKRPLLVQTATDDDTLVLAPFDKPVTLTAWWLPPSAPNAG